MLSEAVGLLSELERCANLAPDARAPGVKVWKL